MSNINDRVAYLKGLAEGMKLTDAGRHAGYGRGDHRAA